jgi:general stress protein 26
VMLETEGDIEWLNDLLGQSHRRSGAHLRSIIRAGERTPTAAQVVVALTGMRVLVVTTVSPSGKPRSSAVDGHFLHGRWVFTTSGDAVKARDIVSRPWVSAAYVDAESFAAFTHGKAEVLMVSHPDRDAIERHLTDHYGSSPATWGPEIVFVRVEPAWMVAYAPDASLLPSSADAIPLG